MSNTVSTGDPETVAACPTCDAADVRERESREPPYRCSRCTARFAAYVERENRHINACRRHSPDKPIIPKFRDAGPLPDRVWASSKNAGVYYRKKCPRLSETPTSRPLSIARGWDTFSPCDYCIGRDDADADPPEVVASD